MPLPIPIPPPPRRRRQQTLLRHLREVNQRPLCRQFRGLLLRKAQNRNLSRQPKRSNRLHSHHPRRPLSLWRKSPSHRTLPGRRHRRQQKVTVSQLSLFSQLFSPCPRQSQRRLFLRHHRPRSPHQEPPHRSRCQHLLLLHRKQLHQPRCHRRQNRHL